ncbi:Gfo/Idh/MocA family oxidoreductase [Gammaproteobacteria bacterium]|nr:Gfo/Idh/MocA family oxidoreductase [Gammaproteobacteria bacterium]
MKIRLGVIGSSEGNGHPYSWSAIFNGYNANAMQHCEFPAIPDYLNKQSWPESKIMEAEVSTIWTQDPELSARIASASCISHVSSSLDDLESRVDAVLLARDDAENHIDYAKQFLLSGKPIYIDKPIALSITALDKLYQFQRYSGQIFTCSALRYSPELSLSSADKEDLGKILEISASTPKSWEKYAVHIVEPVLKMISPRDSIYKAQLSVILEKSQSLNIEWKSGLKTEFTTLGDVQSPIKIQIIGTKGTKVLIFKDSFMAFKLALQDFIDGIIQNECKSPIEFNKKVVKIIERGMK